MIERLGPGDVRRFRAIRLRALRSDPDPFWRTAAEEEALSPDQWAARLSDDARATLVATGQDGADIGLVGIGPPSWDTDADPLDYDLSSMWVAEEARGSGTARALVTAAVDFAARAGARRVTLWVLDSLPRANAFYDKCGFEPTGRTGVFPPPRRLAEHERALLLK